MQLFCFGVRGLQLGDFAAAVVAAALLLLLLLLLLCCCCCFCCCCFCNMPLPICWLSSTSRPIGGLWGVILTLISFGTHVGHLRGNVLTCLLHTWQQGSQQWSIRPLYKYYTLTVGIDYPECTFPKDQTVSVWSQSTHLSPRQLACYHC